MSGHRHSYRQSQCRAQNRNGSICMVLWKPRAGWARFSLMGRPNAILLLEMPGSFRIHLLGEAFPMNSLKIQKSTANSKDWKQHHWVPSKCPPDKVWDRSLTEATELGIRWAMQICVPRTSAEQEEEEESRNSQQPKEHKWETSPPFGGSIPLMIWGISRQTTLGYTPTHTLPLWMPFACGDRVGSGVHCWGKFRKSLSFVIYEVNYHTQLMTGYENN